MGSIRQFRLYVCMNKGRENILGGEYIFRHFSVFSSRDNEMQPDSVAPLAGCDSVFCFADDFFVGLMFALTDDVELKHAAFFTGQ